MPIVIKELIVRAHVDNPPRQRPAPGSVAVPTKASREALVAECVEAVLDVLRRKGER
jgi:Family of unknown function (DUF5908)